MVVCKRLSVNILETSRIWRPHIAPAIVSDWAPESWRTWEVNSAYSAVCTSLLRLRLCRARVSVGGKSKFATAHAHAVCTCAGLRQLLTLNHQHENAKC